MIEAKKVTSANRTKIQKKNKAVHLGVFSPQSSSLLFWSGFPASLKDGAIYLCFFHEITVEVQLASRNAYGVKIMHTKRNEQSLHRI